jgi:UDP-N-acetyl-D-mannosaminuronate dehydrogenase
MQCAVEKVSAAPNGRSWGKDLEQKIRDRTARAGIIGLGYVGLPLALEMGKAGFQVTGIDIDISKAESVNAGNPISSMCRAKLFSP